MNPRTLTCITTITLFAALAIPALLAAANPVPFINQPLVPDATRPGAAGFTLTVNGTGFVPGATVNWNGSPLATTFVSESRLTAAVPASNIAESGTASVTVVIPGPGGGVSNVTFFEVTRRTSSIALSAPLEFGVGSGANWVAVADFNGDGKLDLAVANLYSSDISILLGDGDGTFQPAVNYGAGDAPFSVAVGDFNGDGKLDLVVANYSNVSVLLGNGDGTFQPAVSYAAGNQPQSIAVGDFNRDGKLDFATANNGSNDVSILLGNGDGTFQAAANYAAGSSTGSLALGDFNGDGKPDLAVAGGNNVSILLGNGDGTFQPAVNYAVGAEPLIGPAGDFNGDGKLDLAVGNIGDNNVSVLLGNGDGTFQPAVNYGVGLAPEAPAVGDLNGDGKLDLAVANRNSGDISVLLGNGDGTFQPAVNFKIQTNVFAQAAAVGDFNGDGRLDLALPLNVTVAVLLQIPIVTLQPSTLQFANQAVGTSSAPQTVTVTNTGSAILHIARITITGMNATDFGQTSTCGSALAAGGKCTISVTFTPTQAGPRTASVSITDNAAGSPQSIALSGTGATTGPSAALSPTSLAFTSQLVGTSSPAQQVTLTNYGGQALSITGIAATGDFSESTLAARA